MVSSTTEITPFPLIFEMLFAPTDSAAGFVLGTKTQFIKLRFSYVDRLKTTGEEQLKVLTKWLNDAMK
jgi:hypothetical protein